MVFDIDKHINHLVPHPRHERWPYYIAHFMGYRRGDEEHVRKTAGTTHELAIDFWIFAGSFASLIVIMATFLYGHPFVKHAVPGIIPSWAATVVLLFNAVESPLGQPRNLFFGTMLSSIIGVALMKLFMLQGEEHLWICGALAVAVVSVMMHLTKLTHPPAGAAAILPAVDAQVRNLGWYYLVVQLLTSVLIIAVACLMNNIQRRYPMYWWTPHSLKKSKKLVVNEEKEQVEEVDIEKAAQDDQGGDSDGSVRTAVNEI